MYIIIGSAIIAGCFIGTVLIKIYGFLFMNLILKPGLFIGLQFVKLYYYIKTKRIIKNKINKDKKKVVKNIIKLYSK